MISVAPSALLAVFGKFSYNTTVGLCLVCSEDEQHMK